jgi:phosphatidylserine decarboxylase
MRHWHSYQSEEFMSALDTVVAPIHRAGWPFIAAFAALTAIFALISFVLFWIGVVATVWCVYFFRDPRRTVPQRDGLILSPADGRVSMITLAPPPPELDMGAAPLPRISIFLNIFNVHVNRAPADGAVLLAAYHPGKFLSASLDKASDVNERMAIRYRLTGGQEIVFVQIAGLVARRIVTSVINGQSLRAGERYGLIRFGSRVDVYLPADVQPLVAVGQTAIGGETVLADLASLEPARIGRAL